MSTPCTHRSRPTDAARQRGFSFIELLVAMTIAALGMALASGLLLAGKTHFLQQEKRLEATHAGRAALETILRELRLSGACLPETGDFIAMEAVDDETSDSLTTRYGMTFPEDMSCVQTTTTFAVTPSDSSLPVASVDGFSVGTLVYLRNTNGRGEYFKVASVDGENLELGLDRGLTMPFPATSGVYAIDERRFYVEATEEAAPRLMFQVDRRPAQPFALGIEALDVKYELDNGTIVDQPLDHGQWRSVSQIHVSLTARSIDAHPQGNYHRRNFSVRVKPRNMIGS